MERSISGGRILRKLSKFLFDSFDRLMDDKNFRLDDLKESEDAAGNDVLELIATTGGGHKLDIRLVSLGTKGRWDMFVHSQDGFESKIENVRDSEIDSKLTQLIDDWYGETYEGLEPTINQSEDIVFTMRKLDMGNYQDVQLKSVNCCVSNFDKAASILDNALADDKFIDQLHSEFTDYKLVENSGNSELVEIPYYEGNCNCFEIMLSVCLDAIFDLKTFQWNCNNDMQDIFSDRIWALHNIIDSLAMLSYEKFGCAPDIRTLITDSRSLDTECKDKSYVVSTLASDMERLLDAMYLFYPTLEYDIQNMMDIWIRDIKHFLNFTLCKVL